jgi:hypothetical protein
MCKKKSREINVFRDILLRIISVFSKIISRSYYYFAIIEDFVLRFLWAVSLALSKTEFVHADIVVAIVSPLEIFRRFVWNFFRLENEHLNNCGQLEQSSIFYNR